MERITTTKSLRGFHAVKVQRVAPEQWETVETAPLAHASESGAVLDAKEWAALEGLIYEPGILVS